jgi:hypothetical protein
VLLLVRLLRVDLPGRHSGQKLVGCRPTLSAERLPTAFE